MLVDVTQQDLLHRLPSSGPEWDAAIEYGIDVSLLDENLALTPTERLDQLPAMTEPFEALRSDGDSADT
jgi:hypothetical protein